MRTFLLALAALMLLMAPPAVLAQSVTVIGSSDARDCYRASNTPGTVLGSAIASCNRALGTAELSRKSRAATLVNRGILLSNSGLYYAAFKDFGAALDLIPRFPEALVNRGNAYFAIRELELAIADYTESIVRGTRKPYAAHYNRGLAMEAMGKRAEAFADFVRARDLRPTWKLPADRIARYTADEPSFVQ